MPRRAPPNPFRKRRRANQSARYLNPRQEKEPRSNYDRAGNRTYISTRDK